LPANQLSPLCFKETKFAIVESWVTSVSKGAVYKGLDILWGKLKHKMKQILRILIIQLTLRFQFHG
jgi:hypothetical protein